MLKSGIFCHEVVWLTRLLEQEHVTRAVHRGLVALGDAVSTFGRTIGAVGGAFTAAHLANTATRVRQKKWWRVRPQRGLATIAEGEGEPDGQGPLGPVEGPLPALVVKYLAEPRSVEGRRHKV
jgi:hypothetical protein